MLQSKNLNIITNNDLQYIQFPKLTALSCVRHAFSTRHGGVSTGENSAMNLSFNRGESFETVFQNYRIICSDAGINYNNLVLSQQTHTNNVITVTEEHIGTGTVKPPFSDIDGLVTNREGVALVTQYADCTPLLFCDPVKKVIATSHAGWRGTVKLIGKITVEKMVNEFGCNPQDIVAAIGPCILQCCYEVDQPVFEQFAKIPFLNTSEIFISKPNGRYMLNLAEANRLILINAGVLPNNIDCTDICTCCNHTDLHSHRATNGKRGNLAAIIELI